MEYLGIDTSSGRVFAGGTMVHGTRLDPTPQLLNFAFGRSDGAPDWAEAAGHSVYPKHVFWERSWEPSSRIRRGLAYQQQHGPLGWWVHDPYRTDKDKAAPGMEGRYPMQLMTYQVDPLAGLKGKVGMAGCPKIFIGDEAASSPWTIVAIERATGAGHLVTLKAAWYLGFLPDLVEEKVPASIRTELKRAMNAMISAMAVADLASVVDRGREAVALVMGNFRRATAKTWVRQLKPILRKRRKRRIASRPQPFFPADCIPGPRKPKNCGWVRGRLPNGTRNWRSGWWHLFCKIRAGPNSLRPDRPE